MKYQVLITGAIVLAFAACKTPYRATDTPRAAGDSTAVTTDSTSMNQTSLPDSARMQTDTSAANPMNNPMQDSTAMPATDSTRMASSGDTTRGNTGEQRPTTRDTSAANPMIDSTRTAVSDSANEQNKEVNAANTTTTVSDAPEAVAATFEKQYHGATNMQWSAYDSLAAVPIDMRLTGWKKMKPEDHMVKFDLNGESHFAWYDSKGKWIGSASPMTDIDKLPAAVKTSVNNAIKTRYSGYTISQVNREFQTGKKSYEVELSKDENKVRMLVSSTGKIGQIYRYKTESK